MKQQFEETSRALILKTIQQEFSTFRNTRGGRSPKRLKQLAVTAVKQGSTQIAVAKAAGVATVTIREWLTRVQPRAQQLAIVEEDRQVICRDGRKSSDEVICVRLNSGIEIDIPRSELSFEFLSMLNTIGSVR